MIAGMELQVLQGARQLLQDSDYPPIMLEAWGFSWFKEQREALKLRECCRDTDCRCKVKPRPATREGGCE